MSDCSGPNCTHESHKAENASEHTEYVSPRVLEHRRYKARQEARAKLTANQLKARRRKGVKGY